MASRRSGKLSRVITTSDEARALEVALSRGGFFKLTKGQADAVKSARSGRPPTS